MPLFTDFFELENRKLTQINFGKLNWYLILLYPWVVAVEKISYPGSCLDGVTALEVLVMCRMNEQI